MALSHQSSRHIPILPKERGHSISRQATIDTLTSQNYSTLVTGVKIVKGGPGSCSINRRPYPLSLSGLDSFAAAAFGTLIC